MELIFLWCRLHSCYYLKSLFSQFRDSISVYNTWSAVTVVNRFRKSWSTGYISISFIVWSPTAVSLLTHSHPCAFPCLHPFCFEWELSWYIWRWGYKELPTVSFFVKLSWHNYQLRGMVEGKSGYLRRKQMIIFHVKFRMQK